ncbi:MAG: glycosyltransferase family 4 protein [Pirellulales bacterium]|nr:glycosyltransferase family 4 protein [Pirellulales bacterium]
MKRIAVVGNYVPRLCGIATFTTDLCESLALQFPDATVLAVPVNDREEGYDYPPRVRFELSQNDLTTYRQAADFLNINKVDLVCLQHEFGIFGGPDGGHVLALLRELRTPVVTTLHTIPQYPTARQQKVLGEILDRSDRVVVMSKKGKEFLRELYRVSGDKIDLIPHGIHDVPFTDPNYNKDIFGVEGKRVLLTFGLLSRNKGIETVIHALPEVLDRFPDVVFMVVGATHPNVIRHEGESYRLSLRRLAHDLHVERHVIFYNRFVSLEELMEFIGVADVYVTPYLSQDQITSGTLAYALGAGKAVVSTPYWHAEELLADGRGLLVPFAAPDALARAVAHLLEDEAERHAIRKQAYLAGRKMIWPAVAQQYMQSFRRACQQRHARPRAALPTRTLGEEFAELPPMSLGHLRRLTDDVGILQHAISTVPNYTEGYTTDDNARALMLMVLLEELGKERLTQFGDMASRYLAFLCHAHNPQNGRFRNFMGYDRRWLEDCGSPDSNARAMQGLGAVLGRCRQEGLRRAASRLFEVALPSVQEFTDLRSAAFMLIALHDYLPHFSGDRAAQEARTLLADRLFSTFREFSSRDWPWFEGTLTYANATLPHALLLCGRSLGRDSWVDAALGALEWLMTVQTAPGGYFAPIGNQGFYPRGGEPARFDQQPIEAHATVSACIEAYRQTGEEQWRGRARLAFEWFLGRNDLRLPLYDPVTGGCCDGLSSGGASVNQGAESTLVFLLSLAELRLLEQSLPGEAPLASVTAESEKIVPTKAFRKDLSEVVQP